MLCQNCGKNEATTHLKRIINGETAETHLCTACASSMGYGDLLGGFHLNVNDFFGNLFGGPQPALNETRSARCEKCGSSFQDIAQSGKLGCADCYSLFQERLMPSLQRIHGKTKHVGKSAGADTPAAKAKRHLEGLRTKLVKAVEVQDFEQAAALRDEIKAAEKEAQGNE